jgi:hypothetical protein
MMRKSIRGLKAVCFAVALAIGGPAAPAVARTTASQAASG